MLGTREATDAAIGGRVELSGAEPGHEATFEHLAAGASCAPTVSTGTSAARAAAAPSPSNTAAQTSIRAPLSLRTYSISPALSSVCTGTTTAPSASAPK